MNGNPLRERVHGSKITFPVQDDRAPLPVTVRRILCGVPETDTRAGIHPFGSFPFLSDGRPALFRGNTLETCTSIILPFLTLRQKPFLYLNHHNTILSEIQVFFDIFLPHSPGLVRFTPNGDPLRLTPTRQAHRIAAAFPCFTDNLKEYFGFCM